MENGRKEGNFRALDFAIFIVLFLLSAIVGAVFAYRDRNTQSLENYYFGRRKIAAIPVAISIAVSWVSAITVIAAPAEVYLYGNVFGWYAISILVPTAVGIVYFIPLLHRLRVSSIYEYLELRYHRNIRLVASVLGILNLTAFLSIAVFLPSLTLSAVTPLNLSWTIALTSITCTLYTALGGMKAVIWTDVMQSFIMLAGMAAVFTGSVLRIGGFGFMYSAATRGERDNFLTFDFDPRVRRSAVTILAGGTVGSSFELLCNQIFIQRWLSCKTVKSARMAVSLSLIPLSLFYAFSIGNGLAMYAYYEGCDPMLTREISKPDQMIPRLAVDIFYDLPGIPGLFVSAAFCGTLSTVSSGLNAMSAVGLMDLTNVFFPKLTSRSKVLLSKTFTVLFGVIIMLLAYAMTLATSNAMQIAQVLAGYFGGPFLGIYAMGVVMPWINSKGAVAGFVSGFVFAAWIGISSMFSTFLPEGSERLPVTDANCTINNENQTLVATETYTTMVYTSSNATLNEDQHYSTLDTTLFAISPYMYGPVGLVACIIGAHVASLFCGFSKPSEADPRLFVPLVDNKHLPYAVRKFFRFGVPELSDRQLAPATIYTKGSGVKQSEL